MPASTSAGPRPYTILTQFPTPYGPQAHRPSSSLHSSHVEAHARRCARPFASPRQNLGCAKGSGRELMSLLDAPLEANRLPRGFKHSLLQRAAAVETATISLCLHHYCALLWNCALRWKNNLSGAQRRSCSASTSASNQNIRAMRRMRSLAASFTWMDRYKKFLWPYSVVTDATLSSIAAKHGLEALLRVGGVIGAGVALMTEDAMDQSRSGADWRLTPSDFAFSSAGDSVEEQDDRHQFARAIYYLCWGMVNGNLRRCSSDNFWLLSAGIKIWS